MADRQTRSWKNATSTEIESEIQRTRLAMDETVDELSRKLSPDQMMDRMWHRVREGDGVTGLVRDHPFPLALLGVGLSWLAVEEATGRSIDADSFRSEGDEEGQGPRSRRRRYSTSARAKGRVGPFRGRAAHGKKEGSGIGEKMKQSARGAAEGAGSMGGKAADTARGIAGTVKDTLGQGSEKAQKATQGAKAVATGATSAARGAVSGVGSAGRKMSGTARTAKRKASRGFREMLEEQPLVLAAAAFGIGAAAGMAVPTTGAEDRTLGPARDRMKGEASRAASDAKEIAQEAKEAATDPRASEGSEGGDSRSVPSEGPSPEY